MKRYCVQVNYLWDLKSFFLILTIKLTPNICKNRTGRLEVHMEIDLPDEHGRLQILKIHTSKVIYCY